MKKAAFWLLLACLLVLLVPIETKAAEDSTDEEEKPFNFELPVEGATGYCSVQINLYDKPEIDPQKEIATLLPGTSFVIKGETLDFFYVDVIPERGQEKIGWLKKETILINLPDIIPSIIYYDSNSYSSIFKSSGVALPGVTGKQLYDCYNYNPRFDKNQYIMPVLYPMACKVMQAQKRALANGDSLKIYETYRPYDVQKQVSEALANLMASNAEVNKGISSWGRGWFIATGYSNHQRGKAMDVSLVKVTSKLLCETGDCEYTYISSYEEYEMPTDMHELSTKAVTFKYGVGRDMWKKAPLSKGFKKSEGAQKLQKYCTGAGLTPLASEWWHFDDPDCTSNCTGNFYLTSCVSETP